MKTLLTSVALLIASITFAQSKVEVEDDTASYKGQKFFVGKEFQMGNGSAADKSFVYIYASNTSYTDVKPLYSIYAKHKFTVEKVYNTNRGWSVQTRLPDVKRNEKVIKGEIVFFLIDKAVDNKEVVTE
jgi:hypothetical protein